MEAYDDSNSGGGTLLSTRLNRFCEEEDSGLDGIIIPDDNLSDEDSGSKFRDLSALVKYFPIRTVHTSRIYTTKFKFSMVQYSLPNLFDSSCCVGNFKTGFP